MTKKQKIFRASKRTLEQIQDLCNWLGDTQTNIFAMAINLLWQQEKRRQELLNCDKCGETKMNVQRYIKQRCIGYSEDMKHTHFEHVVELTTGEIKKVWSTDTKTDHGIQQGGLTEEKPFVERVV